MTTPIPDWKARCAARKQQQETSIPSEWRIKLPDIEMRNVMHIVDVSELLAKLRSSEFSAEELVIAFYKQAIIAQQLTNCLTEIFIDQAVEVARELDQILKNTGEVVRPLHGLPVSLKDQFTMRGLETIMGYAAWIGERAESDCVLVETLYQLGAVPFTRTNVPQTLMGGETSSNVFWSDNESVQPVLHPWRLFRWSMKGSCLGVGTDIGGSLRIPSSFCGLYTLRPSYERLPYDGAANALEGQESISSVAKSVSALKTFTKAILDTKPMSEEAYKLDELGGGKQLCFGMMWDNGVVKPHPPLQRAMRMFKEALQSAGHLGKFPFLDVNDFPHQETIFIANGGTDDTEQCRLSGEPLIETMLPETGGHPPQLEMPFVKQLVGPPRLRFWRFHREKRELRKSHLDYWQSNCSINRDRSTDSFYTNLCNAMDYTTSVLPVTFADATIDVKASPHEFHNQEDEAMNHLCRIFMENS
ncbi:amidase signature domain-containing protein [Pterulicium gracile]|uniref:Amidase signature domain-containing protein n=1 Tax=Pterulicium gracile TaxID=1884261 RepID=A0A5C3QRQ5_9AGAR|nr:amidase signature domain-containing protein [Pterula gracilis]